MKKNHCLNLVITAAIMGCSTMSNSAQDFIVKDGAADAQIIVAAEAPRLAEIAATQLQTYLEKISGALLPVLPEPDENQPVKIFVGRSSFTDSLGVTAEGLNHGAYRMVAGVGYLVLLGDDSEYEVKGPVPLNPWPASQPAAQKEWDQMTGSAWVNPMDRTYKGYNSNFGFWMYDESGTMNAVCAYLHMLGVRWYMPGELGEVIPDVASIGLPEMDTTVHPDYRIRHWHWSNYRVGSWENVMWERHLGINSGYQVIGAGESVHGMRNVLGRDELQRAHPEYYALKDGVRDTVFRDVGHACFSQKGLVDETVNYVRAVMDDFGEPMVSIWPVDGYRHCEDSLCEGKTPSELVWNFVDQVAREVYKTHPDRLVSCGAYAQYVDPPEGMEPFTPNLVVYIANRHRPTFDNPVRWDYYQEQINKWKSLVAPGHIVRNENNRWCIADGYEAPITFPVIHPHMMAKDLKAMKGISLGEWNEVGRANIGSDRQQIWRAPGIEHITLYVASRFYWDSRQDVDSLLEEYYTLFYGPARREMKSAFEYAEATYSRCRQDPPWEKCDLNDMDKEQLIQLIEMLQTARDTAGTTIYGQRIRKIIDELPSLESLRPEIKKKPA